MPRVRLILFRKSRQRKRPLRTEARMSLRIRLILLVVALVTLVAVALSALYLDNLVNSLSAEAIERSRVASQQINNFLIDHFNAQSEEYEAPANVEDTKALWYQIVSDDRDVNAMLVKVMAPFPSIDEINVASESGRILASTNEQRIGTTLPGLGDFSQWINESLIRRATDVVARSLKWEVVSPLGIKASPEPILLFKIQMVTSSVFLRPALEPGVKKLAGVSGGSVLAALLITLLATNRALRPLKRIEQTIDRIVQGSYGGEGSLGEPAHGARAKEFAVVESKLDLLGQKFRGAREDASELRHNVDKLIERLASQLDVAARLNAISRLTGGVAHEIKNPLNAIALRLDLVRAKLGAPEEELAPELDILSKEVLRLDRVVKTFLDFSRPIEVHFQEVDLAGLVEEVARLMTPQARLAGITLDLETHSGPASGLASGPAMMRADADMIKQVILNLVTNAMEAMRDGGRLRLAVRRNADTVTLEVADSGPGIPASLRDKVFQLYFTTKTRGSGIGLAMTYRAVQLHNGTIAFTSEEGQGTTFQLQFPAVADA
jgi:signal transduction histidine kinase